MASKPSRIYLQLDNRPFKIAFESFNFQDRCWVLRSHHFRTYKDLLVFYIEQAYRIDPSSIERAVTKNIESWQSDPAQKNLYLAKERDQLFIKSPYLAEANSVNVCGYWLKTNESKKGVRSICSFITMGLNIKRGKWGEFRV